MGRPVALFYSQASAPVQSSCHPWKMQLPGPSALTFSWEEEPVGSWRKPASCEKRLTDCTPCTNADGQEKDFVCLRVSWGEPGVAFSVDQQAAAAGAQSRTLSAPLEGRGAIPKD